MALLAALVFALTPVTVAINRDTNPDTLMVLLLVAAACAFTRSVQSGTQPGRATRWRPGPRVRMGPPRGPIPPEIFVSTRIRSRWPSLPVVQS